VDWNLQGRVQIGEELPPLGQAGKGGEALGTFLRRRQLWSQLRAEAEAQGEELTPYSFRHRFARESHAARLPVATISDAMGHTVAVHLQSYARFQPSGVADAFAAANAQVPATAGAG
jgi:integrase